MTLLFWYLAWQCLAWAIWPLLFTWLHRLPSRGYGLSKALGLLLTGILIWWGGILHLLPFTRSAILLVMAVLVGVGLWRLGPRRAELAAWWRQQRRFILTVELLMAGAWLAWAGVRATQPQLETAGGEKWMEIAFLNAVLRTRYFPPHDPWLSGYAISYYYLGYVLMGVLTRLSGVSATVAFNLANATWFSLAAVGAYSFLYDLLHGKRLLAPFLAPFMLLLVGNAEGFFEVLHARGLLPAAFWPWLNIRNLDLAPTPPFSWVPRRFFWWWQASRTLRDVAPWGQDIEIIDEFPAFSFLLGDMHPHVLALPFVLAAIALAYHRYLTAREEDTVPLLSWRALQGWLPYAAMLGALGFLNTWDFPIYGLLMIGAWLAGLARAHGDDLLAVLDRWPRWLPHALLLAMLSVLLYVPFWIGLRSQAGGFLPNLFNATRWPQFGVMFGPLLAPLAGVVAHALRRAGGRSSAAVTWGLGVLALIILMALVLGLTGGYPYLKAILSGAEIPGVEVPLDVFKQALIQRLLNPWVALLLALGIGAALATLMQRGGSGDAATFPLLLALGGLVLVLAPEFVYLKDVFNHRMNTIFKFYFQAWVLWSLAGAWWLTQTRRRWAQSLAGVMLAVGLVYTVLAIPARAREHGTPWTLDGAAWLRESQPDEAEALAWLNAHVAGAPVILEAPADSYASYVYEGRVSALTGLPTVLGWAGHELQWRGTYDEQAAREQLLGTLFTSADAQLWQAALAQYHVRYVYIGLVERARYAPEVLTFLDQTYPAVFRNGGVVIYQVTP